MNHNVNSMYFCISKDMRYFTIETTKFLYIPPETTKTGTCQAEELDHPIHPEDDSEWFPPIGLPHFVLGLW